METPTNYMRPKFLNTSDDFLKSVTYTGPSMNPSLKASDILQVEPYNSQNIRCGDVIIFIPPGGDHKITHRVISVDSHGIRTKGDNNSDIDSYILSPDNIIGKVVYAQRGNKRLRIHGGLMGQLFALIVKVIRRIGKIISSLLRPAYHRLAKSGIFRKLLPARMKTQILSFNRPAGVELQLLMGRRVIGRRLPGEKQWHIRRPFKLFVDEASLPVGEAHHPNLS